MSLAEFDALTAKVRARAATLEEREAWKAEHGRRFAEQFATQEMPPELSFEERERLDKAVQLEVAQEEANRLTTEVYAEFLKLHAKNDERTPEETAHYTEVGDRFKLHGRPELHQFSPRTTPRVSWRPPPRGRAPRARRVRTSRTSHGPPGRKSADEDPLDPPARLIYAHAARVRDPRVARWLEAWGDESLEDVA